MENVQNYWPPLMEYAEMDGPLEKYLHGLVVEKRNIQMLTNPDMEDTIEEIVSEYKSGEWSVEELCESLIEDGLKCDDDTKYKLEQVMANPDHYHRAVKNLVASSANVNTIIDGIEKKEQNTRHLMQEYHSSVALATKLIYSSGLSLLLHILVMVYLGNVMIAEHNKVWKKFCVYWVVFIFYYNVDVRRLSFRPSSTFTPQVWQYVLINRKSVQDFEDNTIILGLMVLGIFVGGTSYLYPSKPKKNLSNGHLKKLKNRNNLSLAQIHHFCAQGQVDKLKEMIRKHRHNININATDKDGNMPLHLAVTRQQLKVVTLIASEFEEEVDSSLRNSEGYDALDLAIIKNSVKPSMMVHQVLKITNQASLSSLSLALKTDQDNLIEKLISKIPHSLFAPDPSLKEALQSFHKLVTGSKHQNLKRNKKYSLKANLEIQRGLLFDRLEALQSDKPEAWKMEYSCPICFSDMKAPLQIFACVQDHFVCSDCLNSKIDSCPICRVNFRDKPPTRRPLAEKWNA